MPLEQKIAAQTARLHRLTELVISESAQELQALHRQLAATADPSTTYVLRQRVFWLRVAGFVANESATLATRMIEFHRESSAALAAQIQKMSGELHEIRAQIDLLTVNGIESLRVANDPSIAHEVRAVAKATAQATPILFEQTRELLDWQLLHQRMLSDGLLMHMHASLTGIEARCISLEGLLKLVRLRTRQTRMSELRGAAGELLDSLLGPIPPMYKLIAKRIPNLLDPDSSPSASDGAESQAEWDARLEQLLPYIAWCFQEIHAIVLSKRLKALMAQDTMPTAPAIEASVSELTEDELNAELLKRINAMREQRGDQLPNADGG